MTKPAVDRDVAFVAHIVVILCLLSPVAAVIMGIRDGSWSSFFGYLFLPVITVFALFLLAQILRPSNWRRRPAPAASVAAVPETFLDRDTETETERLARMFELPNPTVEAHEREQARLLAEVRRSLEQQD